MLLTNLSSLIPGFLVLDVVVFICVVYAYVCDVRRPTNDPQKKNYHPYAIPLNLVLWPVLVILSVILFLLRVLCYAVFMIVFFLLLVFWRKPFILTWLQKMAIKVGDALLEANTLIIRFFLGLRSPGPA
jgi:hypothetical protein